MLGALSWRQLLRMLSQSSWQLLWNVRNVCDKENHIVSSVVRRIAHFAYVYYYYSVVYSVGTPAAKDSPYYTQCVLSLVFPLDRADVWLTASSPSQVYKHNILYTYLLFDLKGKVERTTCCCLVYALCCWMANVSVCQNTSTI